MTYIQAYSPTGSTIVSSMDTVSASAHINGFTLGADGKPVPEYSGESTIWWDSQTTEMVDGKRVFQDDDGHEWTEDKLIFAPELTEAENEQAQREGWCIITDDDGEDAQIEADHDSDIFTRHGSAYNDEAYAFVRLQASLGSELHRKALAIHRLGQGFDEVVDVVVIVDPTGQVKPLDVNMAVFMEENKDDQLDWADIKTQIFKKGFAVIGGGAVPVSFLFI